MDLNKPIAIYDELLKDVVPVRYDIGHCGIATKADTFRHLKWMLTEMKTFQETERTKSMRWLGFIQGVLWQMGIYSIEDVKNHNWTEG